MVRFLTNRSGGTFEQPHPNPPSYLVVISIRVVKKHRSIFCVFFTGLLISIIDFIGIFRQVCSKPTATHLRFLYKAIDKCPPGLCPFSIGYTENASNNIAFFVQGYRELAPKWMAFSPGPIENGHHNLRHFLPALYKNRILLAGISWQPYTKMPHNPMMECHMSLCVTASSFARCLTLWVFLVNISRLLYWSFCCSLKHWQPLAGVNINEVRQDCCSVLSPLSIRVVRVAHDVFCCSLLIFCVGGMMWSCRHSWPSL